MCGQQWVAPVQTQKIGFRHRVRQQSEGDAAVELSHYSFDSANVSCVGSVSDSPKGIFCSHRPKRAYLE